MTRTQRPKPPIDLTPEDLSIWATVCSRFEGPEPSLIGLARSALKSDAIDAGIMCWAQHWREDLVTEPLWCTAGRTDRIDAGGYIGRKFSSVAA